MPIFPNHTTPTEAIMAWYTQHEVRHRGRLIRVTMRYGGYMSAEVLRGKPLDLDVEFPTTADARRLKEFVHRSPRVREEIAAFVASMDDC